MSEHGDLVLERRFSFKERPAPLIADLRPIWRITLVLLVLESCRGARATFTQLHLLTWAVTDHSAWTAVLAVLADQTQPVEPIVRFDPSLNRAVDLALAFKLLTLEGRRLKIAPEGVQVLGAIRKDAQLYTAERARLEDLPKKVSEKDVERLIAWFGEP